jgi:tetratricopeptide (TPR) repeat protein
MHSPRLTIMHARHSGFLEELDSGTGLPEAEHAEVARGYRLLRIIDHWADGTSLTELGEALADIAVTEHSDVPREPRGAVDDVLHALLGAGDYPVGRTGVASALSRWTKLLYDAAMFHIALDVINVAIEHAADDFTISWQCHRDAAFVQRALGNFVAAEGHYGACIEIGEAVGDSEAIIRGRLGLTKLQRGRGDFPAAENALRELFHDVRLLGNAPLTSAVQQDLGVTIAMRGRFEECLAHLRAALAAAPDGEHDTLLLDIAFARGELGDLSASRSVHEHLAMKSRLGRIRFAARVNLIQIEGVLGNRAAVERHRRDLETQRLPAIISTDFWLTLGRAYMALGELIEARPCFERALALGQQSRMGHVIIAAEDSLATLKMLTEVGAIGRLGMPNYSADSGRRLGNPLTFVVHTALS